MKEINLISSNPHKVEEIKVLAEPFDIKVNWINYTKLEIQAEDPSEIAKIGGELAFKELKKPLIVEDTGIFIKALNGFPGPYAAQCIKTIGLQGVLKLMTGEKDRSAQFKTAIAYVDDKGAKVFEGVVDGTISESIREGRKFAFDTIFIPAGEKMTFSELGLEAKIKYSHRAIAFRKFAEYFTKGK